MSEGFVIDKTKFYGFDYEEDFKVGLAHEAVIAEEVSAKDAFAEFARGEGRDTNNGFWPDEHGSPGGREDNRHDMPRELPHGTPHLMPREEHNQWHNDDHDHEQDLSARHRRPSEHHSGSAPRFAPPNYIPQTAPGLRAVDPGAISRCLYSFTYLWLNNRQQFWFFPTFVGRRSVAGYRWMHNNWVFMGFDLRTISSFFCGGR